MTNDLVKRLDENAALLKDDSFVSRSTAIELLEDCKHRIEALEKALREIYEVYAGSEGIPQPMTAAEGYLLHLVKEMANTARAALGGKKDD